MRTGTFLVLVAQLVCFWKCLLQSLRIPTAFVSYAHSALKLRSILIVGVHDNNVGSERILRWKKSEWRNEASECSDFAKEWMSWKSLKKELWKWRKSEIKVCRLLERKNTVTGCVWAFILMGMVCHVDCLSDSFLNPKQCIVVPSSSVQAQLTSNLSRCHLDHKLLDSSASFHPSHDPSFSTQYPNIQFHLRVSDYTQVLKEYEVPSASQAPRFIPSQ